MAHSIWLMISGAQREWKKWVAENCLLLLSLLNSLQWQSVLSKERKRNLMTNDRRDRHRDGWGIGDQMNGERDWFSVGTGDPIERMKEGKAIDQRE